MKKIPVNAARNTRTCSRKLLINSRGIQQVPVLPARPGLRKLSNSRGIQTPVLPIHPSLRKLLIYSRGFCPVFLRWAKSGHHITTDGEK
jgi:hypothetical protein